MDVITIGTENKGYYSILQESCKKNNINLINIGWGKEWKGFTMRYELLNEYLNNIDDDKIILFIDAYDVIILKDKNKIINTFKKFNKNIVFGDQSSFITKFFFFNCNNYVYNAGSYIGYAKYIKKLINIINDNEIIKKYNNDDQQVLNYKCNENKYNKFFIENTICDINNDIFYITDASTYFNLDYLLFGKLNVPENTCILHLAGSVNGNNYLKKLNYDITKVNDIDITFKLKQVINTNRKNLFIVLLILTIILYLIIKIYY